MLQITLAGESHRLVGRLARGVRVDGLTWMVQLKRRVEFRLSDTEIREMGAMAAVDGRQLSARENELKGHLQGRILDGLVGVLGH